MELIPVTDKRFRPYGKIWKDFDLSGLEKEMEKAPCPDDVVYVASVPEMESLPVCEDFRIRVFGGLPIEIGYCNGHNKKLNALEYHRNSEINIAITDAVLMLGHLWDVEDDNTYDTSRVEAFFVPKGTVVEMYQTTLHYAPASEDGFKVIVILPKETNFDTVPTSVKHDDLKLLTARNKWLIAHPDAKIEGAFNGLKGVNCEL